MPVIESPDEGTQSVPLRVAGRWVETPRPVRSLDPYRQRAVGSISESTPELLEEALDAARSASREVAAMPARERAHRLRQAAAAVRAHAPDIARTMSLETGKPIRDALAEVQRSAETLELSGEEGMRIEGAQVPMETSAIGSGKLGVVLRFPVGVVAAITPFNAPVNLTAHKLGPAWAAGNAVVLKPSPASALTVHRFVEVLLDAGIPGHWLQTVQGDAAAARLVAAPQVDFVSFTGSSRVGAVVKATSGLKRVALELGGIGFTIVEADADIAEAAVACARNSMRLAGQSCISVQTVCVQRSRHAEFLERLIAEVARLRVGDPLDEKTDVGPVISVAAAERVERLVQAAVEDGARCAVGGRRDGALVQPTVLTDLPDGCAFLREEAFGPVVGVMPYDDLQTVFDRINAGPFGLQAGIYTRSMPVALAAIRSLRMGAVIVNGSCTWRSDQAPYGGVKDSGIGREGPRFAIREMTEERFALFNA